MADSDSLALEFEAHRGHLRGVAYRILGSASDADDAVQETWLRLSRTDVSDVLNLRAWLTTVAGRVALNMLESRGTRREEMSAEPPEAATAGPQDGGRPAGPEDEALLGDEVSAALQVVLDTLEPRERLAFVLHDLFAVPFDEIAPVVDTSSAAARQLASRARRRLRGTPPGPVAASLAARADRQREVVNAFFAAAREAQFEALLQLLDPDVVMRADAAAARMGAAASITGADVVARWISGRARGAVLATVGGEPGAVWAVRGSVRVAFSFTIAGDGRITVIDLIGDPVALSALEVAFAGS
ncbi:MAG TPA: sigma-70 family RNA polymerase sigma factor [Trebonia sp.]|jgi:RNA polymerase sigma-70 factor (ECF subfamily)|nr:sigma-70 family RNA polymerase sigma factor [Trebonia sp.]